MSRQVFPQAPSPTMTSLRRISAMAVDQREGGGRGARVLKRTYRLVEARGRKERADEGCCGCLKIGG